MITMFQNVLFLLDNYLYFIIPNHKRYKMMDLSKSKLQNNMYFFNLKLLILEYILYLCLRISQYKYNIIHE